MESTILFFLGIIISYLVTTIIIFQFIESRHKRAYQNDNLYIIIKILVSAFLMFINFFRYPMLNMLSWILVFGVVGFILYFDDNDKPIRRILEVEVMVLVVMICETIGIVILEFFLWKGYTPPLEKNVKTFLSMTFSMLVLLFLYYVVISRIWGKGEKIRFTKSQYILHSIIVIYSLVNMVVIGTVIGKIRSEEESFILLINMGFIVFADMYFLYFTQFLEENNQLKTKLELLEQQATIQYKYYVEQEKKYKQSLHILHDIDKHITAIESLYVEKNQEEAIKYTREIGNILKPLIPRQITNQPLLNILLNDKIEIAEKLNIDFQYVIDQVSFDFMNPIDITTIFGNLLDNAIEECQKIEGSRKIQLKVSMFYEMIAINIENTSTNKCQWKNNKPISQKGLNHGIGLSNIERTLKKYDGSMNLSYSNGKFQCKLIINM